MRALLQRVSRASVTVDDVVVGSIQGPGLLVLLGVTQEDTEEICAAVAAKCAGLRILDGERSCTDLGAPLLVVSQFTLYGDVRKGRRPSWTRAAGRDHSEPLYERFVEELRGLKLRVETGVFGATMDVASVNSGPFTVMVDSEDLALPRR